MKCLRLIMVLVVVLNDLGACAASLPYAENDLGVPPALSQVNALRSVNEEDLSCRVPKLPLLKLEEEQPNSRQNSFNEDGLDCCEKCYVDCFEPWWRKNKWSIEWCCRFFSCGMGQDERCGLCTVCNPDYRERRRRLGQNAQESFV